MCIGSNPREVMESGDWTITVFFPTFSGVDNSEVITSSFIKFILLCYNLDNRSDGNSRFGNSPAPPATSKLVFHGRNTYPRCQVWPFS